MNAIRCKHCRDIIVPMCGSSVSLVRPCMCGSVLVRGVPPIENSNVLVEVKIFEMETSDGVEVESGADVVKINNHFLRGEMVNGQQFQHRNPDNILFYDARSHIVIAPLDTPGVKWVRGGDWSCTKYIIEHEKPSTKRMKAGVKYR